MDDLNVNEIDLLARIREKPTLRQLFFRKAKGLKWFEALDRANYFQPSNLPKPMPASEEGYVTIPRWEVLDYLVKTAPELVGDKAGRYAPRFLEIIRDATEHARKEDFGNYHAWWQFSKLLSQLPRDMIAKEILDATDYWLEDRYDTELVAEVLGEKWLPILLECGDQHSKTLAKELISILYRVNFAEHQTPKTKKLEASLRFSWHRAKKITTEVAFLAGHRLGHDAASIFHSHLISALDKLENDSWSSTWHPAIEENAQNDHHNNAENILVFGYRDGLSGYIDAAPDEAEIHLRKVLGGRHQTAKRVSIFSISKNPQHYSHLWDQLIKDEFLKPNCRHEFWHFLRDNYGDFSKTQKDALLSIVMSKVRIDDHGLELEQASAYERSKWLAAIKNYGSRELDLYINETNLAKTEPEHPDFSTYISTGWVTPDSPFSAEELSAMPLDELLKRLAPLGEDNGRHESAIEGLSKEFRQLLLNNPLHYSEALDSFAELDFAYVYVAIETYGELWREKARIPWDEIWGHLLSLISAVIGQKRFWHPAAAIQRQHFIANRRWIVGAIGRLLEAGTKSDDHAFHEKYLGQAETILKQLLACEKGEKFERESDAVFIAINSPRGQCIEALINLTLRACRLEDKNTGGQHGMSWSHFKPYYDAELERPAMGEYEFATLLTNYLPNFLYMSPEWVIENLERIFDQKDYLKWLCAMKGYSYVDTVYEKIYTYLRERGHLLQALDDTYLKERAKEKVVQHIAFAFLNDFESLEDKTSLIAILISRANFDELNHLIWFVGTWQSNNDEKVRNKAYELWSKLLMAMDLTSNEGQKLASALCQWAGFVDYIDDIKMELLQTIVPYADVSHNSYDLLISLAQMSDTQPFEVNRIWQTMLQAGAVNYPEDAIKRILSNLISQGEKGKRAARETVSAYLERGVEQPSIFLKEMISA